MPNPWTGVPSRDSLAATYDGLVSFELDRDDAATLNSEVPGRGNDLKAAAIVKAILRKLRRMSPPSRARLLRRLGVPT